MPCFGEGVCQRDDDALGTPSGEGRNEKGKVQERSALVDHG
jgi:hypothetical protein